MDGGEQVPARRGPSTGCCGCCVRWPARWAHLRSDLLYMRPGVDLAEALRLSTYLPPRVLRSYPLGLTVFARSPNKVEFPAGVKIRGAAAGRYVSMAVDDDGVLYTWGHDGCSNGGKLPAQAEAWRPRKVEGELAGEKGGGREREGKRGREGC